jgi:UDP-glucose 4-epimerase
VDDMLNGDVANVEHLREDFKVRVVPVVLIPPFEQNHESNRSSETFLIFEGDFCSPTVLRRVVEGHYDTIFHLAAEPSVDISISDPAGTAFNNLQKSIELMAASVGSIQRFVFASSAAVYGNQTDMPVKECAKLFPESPYALQKLQVEETGNLFNKLYDSDFVALRMFNVYGPRQSGSSPYSTVIASWCDKIKSNKPLRLDGDGTQSRDLIYVDDVCSAFLAVASCSSPLGFNTFNVATGNANTNNHILSLFKARWPDLVINQAPQRRGDIKHSVASIEKISTILNFMCDVDVADGLILTLKSYNLLSD